MPRPRVAVLLFKDPVQFVAETGRQKSIKSPPAIISLRHEGSFVQSSLCLMPFDCHLAGQTVRCYTDNQNVVRIVQVGSTVIGLHDNPLEIFLLASLRHIHLASRIRRRKIIDFD